MSSAEVTLNCKPEVFFENHVDFEHFSTVHQGYSDPKLIAVSWTRDDYNTTYSLRYGNRFKQKLVYRYTVKQVGKTCWRGTIETRSFGITCYVDFVAQHCGEQSLITVTTRARAWWLASAFGEIVEKQMLRNYLRDFAADKAEIDGKSGRFPKPVLSEDDFTLSEFRKFVACAA